MKYIQEITNRVNQVDKILHEIKVPGLFENPDFYVDEMSMNSWLKINFKNKDKNRIPFSLTFDPGGLEIRLDRIAEAIDWSSKDLDEYERISTLLKNLFTSYILVEYQGVSRTRICLFSPDGICTNHFEYYEGFSFKKNRTERLYLPIYPK